MKTRRNLSLPAASVLCSLCSLLLAELTAVVPDVHGAEAVALGGGKADTINPEADRLFRQTATRLSTARAFSFTAEVWEDEMVSGHKLSTTKRFEVRLRRPDCLQIEVRSPRRNRGYWQDGKSVTLLDRSQNLFATVPLAGTIDVVMDAAQERFGITFPLEDVLVSDPYANAAAAVKGAAYFGKVNLLGTACQHLAFSTDELDWQLWVSDDKDALPRKLVITYKTEPAAPQYTVLFTKWKLNPSLPDKTFAFTPPKGASRVEMLPSSRQADSD